MASDAEARSAARRIVEEVLAEHARVAEPTANASAPSALAKARIAAELPDTTAKLLARRIVDEVLSENEPASPSGSASTTAGSETAATTGSKPEAAAEPRSEPREPDASGVPAVGAVASETGSGSKDSEARRSARRIVEEVLAEHAAKVTAPPPPDAAPATAATPTRAQPASSSAQVTPASDAPPRAVESPDAPSRGAEAQDSGSEGVQSERSSSRRSVPLADTLFGSVAEPASDSPRVDDDPGDTAGATGDEVDPAADEADNSVELVEPAAADITESGQDAATEEPGQQALTEESGQKVIAESGKGASTEAGDRARSVAQRIVAEVLAKEAASAAAEAVPEREVGLVDDVEPVLERAADTAPDSQELLETEPALQPEPEPEPEPELPTESAPAIEPETTEELNAAQDDLAPELEPAPMTAGDWAETTEPHDQAAAEQTVDDRPAVEDESYDRWAEEQWPSSQANWDNAQPVVTDVGGDWNEEEVDASVDSDVGTVEDADGSPAYDDEGWPAHEDDVEADTISWPVYERGRTEDIYAEPEYDPEYEQAYEPEYEQAYEPAPTKPKRRTGRWLLTTLIGAVGLALLLPLAVRAVLELVSLS